MELLDNQLKEQKTLIKLLEKNKLSAKDRQGVLDTLKQLTNSIDQRRSSIKALEHDMEMSQRRIAKVSGPGQTGLSGVPWRSGICFDSADETRF